MTDPIAELTRTLASDPNSLVFLQLGEALRRRGQTEAAAKVAMAGVDRHPTLLDGHDLYARILVDLGEPEHAMQVWESVLERAPRHAGAHKGLGFVAFQEGDFDAALEHLEAALAQDPTDQSVVRALLTVRDAVSEVEAAREDAAGPPSQELFAGLEGGNARMLLVDARGLVLGGGLRRPDGQDVTEEVGAYLAGVAQEAARTARLLDLGTWAWIVCEGEEGHLYVTPPADECLLLIARDRSVPSGRLGLLAERAAAVARRWLEEQAP